jgi:hypothetical protein
MRIGVFVGQLGIGVFVDHKPKGFKKWSDTAKPAASCYRFYRVRKNHSDTATSKHHYGRDKIIRNR